MSPSSAKLRGAMTAQRPPNSDLAVSAAHTTQPGTLSLQASRDPNPHGTSQAQEGTELPATTDTCFDAQFSSYLVRLASTAGKPQVPVTAHDGSFSISSFARSVEGDVVLKPGRRGMPYPRLLSSPDLDNMPNEILTHIFSYLDVCDLLTTSRTSHHFRSLSLQPILHALRLQYVRTALPPLLTSPSRPTLAELIARHIVLTNTTLASRRLGHNLVAIRLSRRLPYRPSAETLVQRGVLPPECVEGTVAPGLVARKRAVEREKLKDGLRRWIGGAWRGEVRERGEGVRRCDERLGTGRVWRLRKFWERVAGGEPVA